ncbi:MAG: lysophospholipid acyltransferase family protein [Archangium sp.]|nr:lysophospholipid acyltransferase family protein [Archangium sp.]MDP3157555.1 lysophospholipid acyltransferase family protein [Archangium sp.]MDP3571955.1 lysophospholipid acyltransferase family protein [Archangium sp.]
MFERAWRIVATGFCFFVFGLGGVAVTLFVIPPMTLFVRDPLKRVRFSRFVVHHCFRFFIGLMNFVKVLTYELHGIDRLQRPGLLILANHPTLIDVIFIIALIPQSGCVVKSALMRNPFTRGPVKASGYIANDAGLAMVDDCREALESNETLIIFPEGTRTPLSGEVTLQRGAANVAVRCRKAVTPVTITADPRGLAKGQKWYRVPPRRIHFVIRVHDDLQVDPFLESGAAEPVAVRRLNEHLTSFFEQESVRAAP